MEYAFAFVEKLIEVRYEDDFVDRLNYQYTPVLMVVCASLIFAKLAVGSSIQCFTKAQFKNTWNAYTHDYCLIENTYFVPLNATIPGESERSGPQLAYYQWTGFILAGLALLSMFPHVLWRSFNWISGYHIRPLIMECSKTLSDASAQPAVVKQSANLLLTASHLDHRYFRIFPRNTFVTFLYFFMKFSFVAAILTQLKTISVFLGSFAYPFQVLRYDLGDWQNSGLFPRVTLCDIDIRVPGQYQKYTMECTLPLNMLNEKIFVFLFFYLLGLALLTVANIGYWIWLLADRRTLVAQIRQCQHQSIRSKDAEEKESLLNHEDVSALIDDFAWKMRGLTDLTLVLQLLKKQVGMFLMSDVFLKMAEIDQETSIERKKMGQRH
ncbi:hypothetical protein QR680_008963 [Steinernema hermaphroditum]|uniref:Innexin n=1 Tax=Steinernema hermaphroditum TaxID=289476 RepID=A0AA39M8U6_9BILA|nr:hypothetical protein QR680_008963 [Steinernema hermaphroditum]